MKDGVDRRSLLGVSVGLTLASGIATAAGAANPPPTPAVGDPDAPQWPAAERFPLWPAGRIPGAPARLPTPNLTMNGGQGARQLWVRGVATPEVAVYRPARPDGSALLSIPGGGYEFLSVQNEGTEVARRFTAGGTTVFVLVYRLPAEGWADRAVVPLQDAQRAIRLIRADAAHFGIDPARLGVLGFSAGGHLAADVATAWDRATYHPVDEADAQPARPAFAGLVYPVATLEPPIAHAGSREYLLGPDAPAAEVRDRSPLAHVRPDMPPTFLLHALDDGLVPVENSIRMLDALRAARVPCEAHFLEHGGHGFGLGLSPANPGALWPDLFERWRRTHA